MVLHVNIYGHMQLDTLTVIVTHYIGIHVLHHQGHPLFLLLHPTIYYCESGADANSRVTYYLSKPLWNGGYCSFNCCCNIKL